MTVDEDTLFYFYIARGGVTPQMRAQNAQQAIETIGKKLVIKTDSVKIEKTDIVSDIMYGNQVLFSITDRDALWEPDPDTETHSLFHISRCRTMAVIPVYQLDLPQIAYPYRPSERYLPETGHAAKLLAPRHRKTSTSASDRCQSAPLSVHARTVTVQRTTLL